MYRVVTAGTIDEIEQAWREIRFWIERPNTPLSKFNVKRPGSFDASKVNVTTTLEQELIQDEHMLANEINFSTPQSISNPYQQLFGWHGIGVRKEPTTAATRIESKHIPTLCSQDIYQSFLCTIADYLNFEKEATIATGSTIRFEHQLVSKLIDCFEVSGLGSRQDASLVIVPVLQNRSILPRASKAIPSSYRVAEKLRKNDNFKEVEEVLRLAWGAMTELGEPRDTTLIELGELYRYALFSDIWQEFGKIGIDWMGSQGKISIPGPENEVIARYVELKKRPRESRTWQQVLHVILRNDRSETLWSISQLERSDSGIPIDEESGRSVLSFLCQKGWFELVRATLEIGSVVDSIDKKGHTPLSYAAEHGNVSVLSILMESNAFPITEDLSRRSPLSYAAAEGHIAVIETLLSDPRVNTYTKDAENCSPLHWAAANGHNDAIICLVDHGASVYDMDINEHTPLVAALLNTRRSRFDRRQTAELLVQMKSKLDHTIQGKELWEWALENDEFVCAAYILEKYPRNLAVIINIVTKTPDFTIGSVPEQHPPKSGKLLSLPGFHSAFKIIFTHNRMQETFIKMESIMRIAKGDFNIEITRVHDGSQQWINEERRKYKILNLLLDEIHEVDAIKELVRVPTTNHGSGDEVMSILFDRYGPHIKLTEDVVMAATENPWQGRNIIELLLGRKGDQVPITEYVVKSAASNKDQGQEIIQLLFDQRGDQVPITERVVESAASNKDQVQKIMQLLFEQRADEVPMTEDVVRAAASNWNGKAIIELLLNQRGDQVPGTEDVVKAAIANMNGRPIIKLLLDERRVQVPITEDVVKAAASSWSGRATIQLFLDERGDQVPITRDAVKAAACNQQQGQAIMKLLHDRRGDQIPITEEIVQAACVNRLQGQDIIRLLLNRRGDLDPKLKEMLRRNKSQIY